MSDSDRRDRTDNPALLDEHPRHAIQRLIPDATDVRTVDNRAHLARVESASGSWCVRRWPSGTAPERIAFVHDLLRASREGDCTFVSDLPEGSPAFIEDDGHFFDAQSWLPGRSPSRGLDVHDQAGRVINRPAKISESALASAVTRLGRWHVALTPLASREQIPAMPLDSFVRAVRATWEFHRQELRPVASRTPHIQRWLRSSETVLPAAVDALDGADYLRGRPLVVGHLNLWPRHLLFSRGDGTDQLTGLIDFERAAATSPLIDLAQTLTRFNGWSGGAAEEVIGAYATVAPLAPEERRLLPAVAGLDLIAEIGRLLAWGYLSQSIAETGGGDLIRAGASAMLLSLEAVAPAVARGDRKEAPKARQWVHRPRPTPPAKPRQPRKDRPPRP